MADIFISYSSEDKTVVQRIASLLEKRGWSVWWDRQIPIGQSFDTVIETELQNAGCVLVIWTKRSVASEWVKNEAADAAKRKKLVPVVLEQLTLPLEFRRIESALLIDWNGIDDNIELNILYQSIQSILQRDPASIKIDNKIADANLKPATSSKKQIRLYAIIAIAGFIVSALLAYYYLHYRQPDASDENRGLIVYLLLIVFGIAVSAIVFGIMNTYAVIKTGYHNIKLSMIGPGVGVLLVIAGWAKFRPRPVDTRYKTATIRLFDHNKKPVPQGNVKIYLNQYIRTQSVDDMGQALFTEIPAEMTRDKMKIEVTSPGYTMQTFDTLLIDDKPIDLMMKLKTVVVITGSVTTAADNPIKNVEVSVDGTKYYAITVNNGSYSLRLQEYTLGDEISITTSHKDYEDKTILVTIDGPSLTRNIVLNPVAH